MTALTTFTGVSDLTEIIKTEEIDNFIASYQYTPRVGEQVAWMKPGAPKSTIPVKFPRWKRLNAQTTPGVPAGAKSETDVFTDVDIDTTEGSVTPGYVGFRLPVSDEAMANAGATIGQGFEASLLAECFSAMLDRMDADILAVSAGATTTAGAITDNFTLDKLNAGIATYRATNPPDGGAHAFVGHNDAFRDLIASTTSSTSPFNAAVASAMNLGAIAGYKGNYAGIEMFESGNVVAESTGWSNFLTPMGNQRSGVALVMGEGVRIVPTRGDDAEVRKTTYLVVSAVYGTGLINPDRVTEVLSRT